MAKIRNFYKNRLTLTFLVFVHCVMPTVFGGMIYVLFRPLSLKMFDWFEFIGLMDSILSMRAACENYLFLPDWFNYALPDGLWTYAFTSSFILIWENSTGLKYWLAIPLFLSLIPEVLQFFNLLTGTFDWNDLLFQLFGFISSIVYFKVLKASVINN
jgi:hypothetical protein